MTSHDPVVVPRPKHDVVYLALCFLVLCAGVIAVRSTVMNANVTAVYEIIFIVIYAFYLKPSSDIRSAIKANPIPYAVGFTWVMSVTVSLIWSPLGVGSEPFGVMRFNQTIFHVMFFFFLRDFLSRYPVPLHWVLLIIPASGVIVALGMAVLLTQVDTYDAATAEQWFLDPPFNGHIRYTGYLIAAAIAVLLPFFLSSGRPPVPRPLLFGALVILCTLLFWMGGRASILGAGAAFVCIAVVAAAKGVRSRYLWLAFPASMAIGIVLADLAAVFYWNGVFYAVTKTAEAPDLARVTSGRLLLWLEAWESVRPHLAFGLGPQGYLFMPNRSFGVQPHSALVQFVVEWGLVGAALFLGLLAYGFWIGFAAHVARATAGLDPAALSAGSIIVALGVLGLVDGTFYHPQPSLYLAIAFAIWTLPRREGGSPRQAAIAR